jgi:hypothetical protein
MECSPEKVEGQVTAVDQNSGRVTIRDANGGTHEFQTNKRDGEGHEARRQDRGEASRSAEVLMR